MPCVHVFAISDTLRLCLTPSMVFNLEFRFWQFLKSPVSASPESPEIMSWCIARNSVSSFESDYLSAIHPESFCNVKSMLESTYRNGLTKSRLPKFTPLTCNYWAKTRPMFAPNPSPIMLNWSILILMLPLSSHSKISSSITRAISRLV